MELSPTDRPKFTIEDPQEASASDVDAEDELTGVITMESNLNDDVSFTEEASDAPLTENVESSILDAELLDKDESFVSIPSQSNISAMDTTPKSKIKQLNRVAFSYTQHFLTQPVDIIEYEWPQKSADYYFVQEQISQLLDVKSFKRKYPDMVRRTIEPEERDFLIKIKELGKTVPVHLLNHLTALRSIEVLDLISAEYPMFHAEYQKVVAERRKQELIEKQKELDLIKSDTRKLEELRKKSIKLAAKFNKNLQTARRSDRTSFYDSQTSIIQSATNRWLRLPPEATRPSPYSLALIPGQFSSHYKKFTCEELNRMPLNTVMENDDLFVPKRGRSPSPIYVSDKEVIRTDKGLNDGESETVVKQEVENQELVEKPPPPRSGPGRRPSTASNGGPSPKKPRKNLTGVARALFSEAAATISSVKKESVSVLSPFTSGFGAGTSSNFLPIANSPILEEETDTNYSSNNGNTNDADVNEDDARCIICNFREAEIPTHTLAEDLGRKTQQTPFVRCADCGHQMHAGCIDMSPAMVNIARSYEWRCAECKECMVCGKPDQEDAMMCCDLCDRGYHTFCIGIMSPPNGQFICSKCEK